MMKIRKMRCWTRTSGNKQSVLETSVYGMLSVWFSKDIKLWKTECSLSKWERKQFAFSTFHRIVRSLNVSDRGATYGSLRNYITWFFRYSSITEQIVCWIIVLGFVAHFQAFGFFVGRQWRRRRRLICLLQWLLMAV